MSKGSLLAMVTHSVNRDGTRASREQSLGQGYILLALCSMTQANPHLSLSLPFPITVTRGSSDKSDGGGGDNSSSPLIHKVQHQPFIHTSAPGTVPSP